MCVQYLMDMRPEIRSQLDCVFACREAMIPNRQRLFEQFFGYFDSLAQFSSAFDTCTADYKCLVALPGSSTRLEDNVFWWKAPYPVPSFIIGKPWVYTLAAQHLRSENEDVVVQSDAAIACVDEDGKSTVRSTD